MRVEAYGTTSRTQVKQCPSCLCPELAFESAQSLLGNSSRDEAFVGFGGGPGDDPPLLRPPLPPELASLHTPSRS